jgi:hypothetical protein
LVAGSPPVDYFSRAGFFLLHFRNRQVGSRRQPTPPTMTIHELHQEIRDRRALARHANRHGLCVARLWHVEQAAAARRKLRNLLKL